MLEGDLYFYQHCHQVLLLPPPLWLPLLLELIELPLIHIGFADCQASVLTVNPFSSNWCIHCSLVKRESITSPQHPLPYESYEHLFYECEKNKESGQALLRCIKSYDSSLSQVKSLRLELTADEPFLLASISLLASGLQLIWENRRVKKSTALYMMRADLENSVTIKRKSRLKKVRETAEIMGNMIVNFLN